MSEKESNEQKQRSESCKLAVWSLVFEILGSITFGAMWTYLFFGLIQEGAAKAMFWIWVGLCTLGFILGIRALKQIKNSEGKLVGRGCAISGILIFAGWVFITLAIIIIPTAYYWYSLWLIRDII
jgi:hypothetical protein